MFIMPNREAHTPQGERYTVHHENGRRIVRQTQTDAGGRVYVVEHDLPDAVQHHYVPSELNEPILLYRGSLAFEGSDSSDPPYDGDIRFVWTPAPGIQCRGERDLHVTDFNHVLQFDQPNAVWVERPTVVLPSEVPIPTQPDSEKGDWSKQPGTASVDERLGAQDVGTAVELDRLTFLIPNGWDSMDGQAICDPQDLMRFWHGRFKASAAGWELVVDSRPETHSHEFRRELRSRGGHYITHIAQLDRTDGAPFEGTSALEILEAIRLALSLAVGRTVNCVLPVGWRGTEAVWTRWSAPPIDSFRSVQSWLDVTIASEQLSHLFERMIAFGEDAYRRDVIRYAVSYYVTANFDVDVELATAVPVSGLQLLSFYRFVELQGTLSAKEWNALDTGSQVRRLLDECRIDTAVPAGFNELQAVVSRLPAGFRGNRDALGAIIYLRNKITHPTKKRPGEWSLYEWAEASMVARHYLALAVLNTIGYEGKEHSPTGTSRRLGQVTDVPWASTRAP